MEEWVNYVAHTHRRVFVCAGESVCAYREKLCGRGSSVPEANEAVAAWSLFLTPQVSPKAYLKNRANRKVQKGQGTTCLNDVALPSDTLYYCGATLKECR